MVALFYLSVSLGTAISGELARFYTAEKEGTYFGALGRDLPRDWRPACRSLALGAQADARSALNTPGAHSAKTLLRTPKMF
jgi:hypothetical protein